jgi:Fe-S-cluster containining protein
MYTATTVDPAKPPRATRHLNARVLCGTCRYKCCNSPSLVVEATPAEQRRLSLPQIFEQHGHCSQLTPTGCRHGSDRPVFCKLFPLQVTPHNTLIVSRWAIMTCPMAHHYRETAAGRHVRRENLGPKARLDNSAAALTGDLREWPTALEAGREALTEIYGAAGYQAIVDDLAAINRKDVADAMAVAVADHIQLALFP